MAPRLPYALMFKNDIDSDTQSAEIFRVDLIKPDEVAYPGKPLEVNQIRTAEIKGENGAVVDSYLGLVLEIGKTLKHSRSLFTAVPVAEYIFCYAVRHYCSCDFHSFFRY